MEIIVVDDEKLVVEDILTLLKEIQPEWEVTGFSDVDDVFVYLSQNDVDVAFLDIDLDGYSGIDLAKRCKCICPQVNIIFITGYSQYTIEAFKLRVSGYLMKPVEKADIARELENLRYPVQGKRNGFRIRVQAFGNFEVFADDIPVKFQYSKTKEMLAYLIDRKGAFCSNGELISILWEEGDMMKRKSHFRDLRADLMNVLKKYGCSDAVLRQRGQIAIVPERISCDYFDWLKGEPYAINAYTGEYMTQYSWGEFTLGGIEKNMK